MGWTISLCRRAKSGQPHEGSDVLIRASSWVAAQRALHLVDGCWLLLEGSPAPLRFPLFAHNDAEPEWIEPRGRRHLADSSWRALGFPRACELAALASRRRRWVYAIARLRFSQKLFSVESVDLEPFTSSHLSVSALPADHITFSHAIVSAYSAIEELGLELRASNKRPSRINGEWNPEVRADLERRLRRAGVDLDDDVLWMVRARRKLETARPVPATRLVPWCGWGVRDADLRVCDAIAYAHWLRSCVAAHTAKDLTRVLSPYDVVNVQMLVRRLILDVLAVDTTAPPARRRGNWVTGHGR
jgi:hypothetical protein